MAIIQKPDSLSLLGNLKKFIVSSGGQISFSLLDGDTVLLESTYEPGTDGRATIDVRDIVESRLAYTINSGNFYEQPAIVKTFTAIVDGVSVSFRVIRAGVAQLADTVSNWLRGNFLTWQPTSKPVTYYTPEWLTYYAQESCNIMLKATFPDDTVQNLNLGACEAGKAFTCNVQYAVISGLLGQKYPSYFDVWVENSFGSRLTYVQRYLYDEQRSELEQWFFFENSLGGLDTFRASGDTDFDASHEHKLSSIDDVSSEYEIKTDRNYSKNTGYLDDYERRWLLDFFPSRKKYIYHGAAIRSIVVTQSDVQYAASDLPSSYNFTYRFTADNEAALLNLVRNQEDIPASITIPDIDSPDFHLPPRLSEYPRVPLHEGVIFPAFDPYNQESSVTTLGSILAAAVHEVLTRIAAGEGGGELVNVLRSASAEVASDYSVFSSLRTLLEIRKQKMILIKKDDETASSDETAYSSLRTDEEILKALENFNSEVDDKYLRKDIDDTAAGLITFLEGLVSHKIATFLSGIIAADLSTFTDLIASGTISAENVDVSNHLLTNTLRVITQADILTILLRGQINSESFTSGMLGNGMRLRKNGEDWELELDKITVRKAMTVYELIVQQMRYQGGQHIFGPAGGKITKVTSGGSYWRCEHDGSADFITGSQVLCERFMVGSRLENPDGSSTFKGARVKRYWRLVTSYGNGWFNLSKTDCEFGSDYPEINDQVAVLGHRTNTDWQNAIVVASTGSDTPYWAHYAGINSYSLIGKEVIRQGNLGGIVDPHFGQLHGHGLYGENVFLKGIFRLSNNKMVEDAINDVYKLKVGALNLLREYDGRFSGKYWGEEVELTDVDFDSITPHQVKIVADNSNVLVDERGFAFKVIL